MGPSGAIWGHLGPSGAIWAICTHLRPYGVIWDHTGPYGVLCSLHVGSRNELVNSEEVQSHRLIQAVNHGAHQKRTPLPYTFSKNALATSVGGARAVLESVKRTGHWHAFGNGKGGVWHRVHHYGFGCYVYTDPRPRTRQAAARGARDNYVACQEACGPLIEGAPNLFGSHLSPSRLNACEGHFTGVCSGAPWPPPPPPKPKPPKNSQEPDC